MKKNEKKKLKQKPEMGYCPFEHWLGAGAGAGRAGRAAGGRWARGLAKAVHSVHSACFWPSLTQYCS